MKSNSGFTNVILTEIGRIYGDEHAQEIFERSDLIKYLDIKMRSADRGSKARGSFANIYAIFVLVEDYVANGFEKKGNYSKYAGAQYNALFIRQRQLPFGEKLQNHGLNSRCNEEFAKYFPATDARPIIRDLESRRYWINERLLVVGTSQGSINLCGAVLAIVKQYIAAKKDAFEAFIADCERLEGMVSVDEDALIKFITDLLRPNVDARIFEIASFSILATRYADQTVWFGDSEDLVEEHRLELFKTGRTNANDGGIDFVMRPVGRFFQVTETADVRKYFLDIDKVQRFPITFVVKTEEPAYQVRLRMREFAEQSYPVTKIVDDYMEAIEEIITLIDLREHVDFLSAAAQLPDVLARLRLQAYVEFNVDPDARTGIDLGQ